MEMICDKVFDEKWAVKHLRHVFLKFVIVFFKMSCIGLGYFVRLRLYNEIRVI